MLSDDTLTALRARADQEQATFDTTLDTMIEGARLVGLVDPDWGRTEQVSVILSILTPKLERTPKGAIIALLSTALQRLAA